ncbi:MAG TPA: hypothetical protein GXX70_02345 [Tepidimicrobium sp.]|nr:hypothetical protein [Tepidimicrobium sp.]
MEANGKKIIVSLIIALLLGTSMGHAQSNNLYYARYNSQTNRGGRPIYYNQPYDRYKSDTSVADYSMEMEVLRLVNIERQKAGLAPFVHSEELSKVARTKSEDMARNNYFSHNSPTYGDPFSMIRSFGIQYRTAGENIAKGYSSAQSVMNGWMGSSGHRANILNPAFGKIGIGYANINGTSYWTQTFTN